MPLMDSVMLEDLVLIMTVNAKITWMIMMIMMIIPILVILVGSVTDVTEEHQSKAPSPNDRVGLVLVVKKFWYCGHCF